MAQGGCHCGAIRYEVAGEPARHSICHCSDCRRHAGAPLVAWAIFPQDRFTLLKGEPAVYASSTHGRRHFCAGCGTGLFYTNAEIFAGLVDIQSATLDDPDRFPPTEHVQVAERIEWMEQAHRLPEHARYPEQG